MSGPFGVTPTGFAKKTLEQILDDLKTALLEQISPNLNLTSTSALGVAVGIFAERLSDVWDLAEAVYNARDPDGATGFSLDHVAAITGTVREPATRSSVFLKLNLDAATTIPSGSIASVAGNPTAQFRTVVGLTSAGAGDYNIQAEAVETGPVVGNAGTITVIVTPIAGWNSVTNVLDAELGSDVESDASLRLRREEELRRQGTSPVDALRSDLLDVEDVTQSRVFENPSDMFDADGLPPHSFEAVVLGGTDAAVAQKIWDGKAAGIATYGSTTEVVEDSTGLAHDVSFTRPTEVDISIAVEVLTDPDEFPVDGDDQIKAALVALGDTAEIGEDVIRVRFYAPIFTVAGVVNVTVLRVDDVYPAVATGDVTIASRSIAIFDTSRIDIVVT